MNFRIPIISDIAEKREANRTAQMQRVQAETQYFKERTTALKSMQETSKTIATELVSKVSAPVMSLDQELYGNSNQPYASRIWQDSTDGARRQSRIAYWSSPEAQAMIGRFVDMVYGPRLELQSMPVWDLIPGAGTDTAKHTAIVKGIEARWKLFAKAKYSDYCGEKNHYQRSRQNFFDLLLDGEYFNVLRYSSSRKRNPLTVQRIKPENIKRVSSQVLSGNTECDGIEYNAKGEAIAYHIFDPLTSQSTRVPKFGPRSGRQLVIHNKLGDGRRGVGILAGIISEITKLGDFQALEIQAAVINAMFAVWVKTEIGGDNKNLIPKSGISGLTNTENYKERLSTSEYEARLNSTEFNRGGMIVQGMGEGQELHSFDTKRPTANFEQFFNAVKRSLYSAKGMSIAVADYNFNGSYSAARGELLVFWNRVMTLRYDHMTDYEDIIFQMWLWGEIDNGNIIAPGWQDETIRDAWSNAYWVGPSRPDIDPESTAKANEIDRKYAWKTDSEISAERSGSDWSENIERKIEENKKIATANEPLTVLDKTSYSVSEAKTESTSTSKTIRG